MLKPTLALFLSLAIFAPSSVAAGQCPVINGTYVYEIDLGEFIKRFTITHRTRQQGSVFSYTKGQDDTFQIADGQARPIRLGIREGKLRFTCGENTLIVESWADDSDFIFRSELTPLNRNELRVVTNIREHNGIYVKQ